MSNNSANHVVVWLTGLSGSGKSTLAQLLCTKLQSENITTAIVDGDVIREKKHKHLGFSKEDIIENNTLITQYCAENLSNFQVQLVPVIAPFQQTRIAAREALKDAYIEVYVKAGLETVIQRDTKGLYAQAKAGKLQNLIGFDTKTPYEPPTEPDLTVETEIESIEESAKKIYDIIKKKFGG